MGNLTSHNRSQETTSNSKKMVKKGVKKGVNREKRQNKSQNTIDRNPPHWPDTTEIDRI